MRPVRLLLVAVALLAVGLTGWALGVRGDGYSAPDANATATTAPTDPNAGIETVPDGLPASDTQPAPPPRIAGFGSEPVLATEGSFWRLSPGPGLVTFVLDAQHASRVEFWLTPTGSSVSDLSRKIGQDSNGRDGWLLNWHYPDEPILGHLTVRAIGPGGSDEETVGVYHPDPGA